MVGLLKYRARLPFNRIEKLQDGMGIPLPAATQWDLVQAAAKNAGYHFPVCTRGLKAALGDLFRQRWHVELDLRAIKTTLQMAELSCNIPQMNEKELWVHFLAYNLSRTLIAQAAAKVAVHPRTLSFKHTVQLWSEWITRGLSHRASHSIDLLFTVIGQLRVGNWPGRIEPRARKRRPKPYPWLKIPRSQARSNIMAHGHA
jgi:hypothetical protein